MKNKRWPLFRVLQVFSWTALVLFVLVALGFARKEQDSMLCRDVEIRVQPELEPAFTDWDDIAHLITGDGNVAAMVGKPMFSFDAGELEHKLENDPYIENAEVFKDMDGSLAIEVQQRNPLFRIFRQGSNGFYVDDKGWKMPLSEKYTARVIVVRGYILEGYNGNDSIKTKELLDTYLLVKALNAKEFWRQQIEEIMVDDKGEFTLIPKVGDQRILLGSAENLDEKLYKLRLFYKHAMNRVGWSTYKVINLKYSGQVVCEK